MGIDSKALFRAMADRGLTGIALSRVAGVTNNTISKYMNGKGKTFNPETLKKIADALGVKPSSLLTD